MAGEIYLVTQMKGGRNLEKAEPLSTMAFAVVFHRAPSAIGNGVSEPVMHFDRNVSLRAEGPKQASPATVFSLQGKEEGF